MTGDRTLLLEALARLAGALDAKDWPAIAASFTADAQGYGAHGRDAIVARVRDHLGGCGATQHLLGNHRITLDGDTASSLTYARVHHVGAGPKEGSFFECMGEYVDHWVRTGQGWQLTYRAFDMRIRLGDFDALRPG